MTRPKISIILPIYKVEKYLKKCIDSILAQTFKDFELILVDDGSPDRCPEICDEYAKLDQRIRVIHKKNGGLSDARNAGLDIAQGDFVGFVDSDDYVSKQMLEVMYKNIVKYNADWVMGNYVRVDQNDCIIHDNNAYQIHAERCYSRDEFIEELVTEHGSFFVIAWSKLYKRDVFEHLRFPKGKQHEDEFLIHHIVGRSEKIVCIKEVVYYYLQRSESIMNTNFNVNRMDYGEALIDRYHYTKNIKKKEWKDSTVKKLTYELEKWNLIAKDDLKVKNRYDNLRKKALFLLFERQAWNNGIYNWKGRLYMKVMFLLNRR